MEKDDDSWNKIHENDGSNPVENQKISKNSAGEEEEDEGVDRDEESSMKTYCSCKFITGFMLGNVCLICHIYLVQYLDLALLAANSSTAIVAAIILSIVMLEE